ncbi:hypothetical protein GF376_00925 [Candidatus Peregrinibacteria bacterium]|nr:hypothetical protein [Candidatus Peregrinibacteria bacterium]
MTQGNAAEDIFNLNDVEGIDAGWEIPEDENIVDLKKDTQQKVKKVLEPIPGSKPAPYSTKPIDKLDSSQPIPVSPEIEDMKARLKKEFENKKPVEHIKGLDAQSDSWQNLSGYINEELQGSDKINEYQEQEYYKAFPEILNNNFGIVIDYENKTVIAKEALEKNKRVFVLRNKNLVEITGSKEVNLNDDDILFAIGENILSKVNRDLNNGRLDESYKEFLSNREITYLLALLNSSKGKNMHKKIESQIQKLVPDQKITNQFALIKM